MSERVVDGDDSLAQQGDQEQEQEQGQGQEQEQGQSRGQGNSSISQRQPDVQGSHPRRSSTKKLSTNPADYVLDSTIEGRLKRNPDGLVPAVVQDVRTGDVLMLAWMDDHALAYTIATRQGTYWSRSRQEYWVKGLTSGHTQKVADVRLDCDGDTVLLKVEQTGAACHTGDWTCFDAGALL